MSRLTAAVSVLAIALAAGPASAANYAILHSFTGGTDGAYPRSNIVEDASGNLYTATSAGGLSDCRSSGQAIACGVLDRIAPDGTVTPIVTFKRPIGGTPGFIVLSGTTIYGTAGNGGPSNDGLIYQVNTDGTKFKVLHEFSYTDGADPNTLLLAGNILYGTASIGGTGGSPNDGGGVLFKLTADGTFTALYNFGSSKDGYYPTALLAGRGGVLYGTTEQGGFAPDGGGGIVFSYTPATAKFTRLVSFDGSFPSNATGSDPTLGSIAPDGTLYGSARGGGTANLGTLWHLAAGGALTAIYSFTGGRDGANPYGGPLLQGTTALVGTAPDDVTGTGPLYSFDGTTLTVLHRFIGVGDGSSARGLPLATATGAIYGTTEGGGASDMGIVYVQTP